MSSEARRRGRHVTILQRPFYDEFSLFFPIEAKIAEDWKRLGGLRPR